MAKKGFIAGLVIGAAAALALAPKKGSELRQDARDKYEDFKDDPQGTLQDTLADVKDFSVDYFNDVKAKFESGEYSAEKAKDYLLDKRDFIKEKVESGDLSLDSVRDFFTKTKDSLAEEVDAFTDEYVDDGDLAVNYSWTESEEDENAIK